MWPPLKLTLAVGLAIALLITLALMGEREGATPGNSCSPIGATAADRKGQPIICSEFTRFNPNTGQFDKTGRGFWRYP